MNIVNTMFWMKRNAHQESTIAKVDMVIPNVMLWMQKNAYEPTTIKKTAKSSDTC
jgi:hypothetical protein